MIAPPRLPRDWATTVDRLKLTEASRFVKLGCAIEAALPGADSVAALDPGLRVGLVEPTRRTGGPRS